MHVHVHVHNMQLHVNLSVGMEGTAQDQDYVHVIVTDGRARDVNKVSHPVTWQCRVMMYLVQLSATPHVVLGGHAHYLDIATVPQDGWGTHVQRVRKKILHNFITLYAMSAICDPVCKKGGTCSAPDECSCTAEWSGDTCSQGKCHCCNVI